MLPGHAAVVHGGAGPDIDREAVGGGVVAIRMVVLAGDGSAVHAQHALGTRDRGRQQGEEAQAQQPEARGLDDRGARRKQGVVLEAHHPLQHLEHA